MAWPAPRRPAPGGGLAVLVVVTMLAMLAAPHAKAFRGLVASGLPAINAPDRSATRPGARPPAGLTFTSAAGCRPAGDWTSPRLDRRVRQLLVAAAGRYRIGCRACAAAIPGSSRAPAGCRITASGAGSTSTRSTAARSAAPTSPRAGWRSGSARAGLVCSRARSALPGASAGGPGSATPTTRGICMSASVARPGPGGGR